MTTTPHRQLRGLRVQLQANWAPIAWDVGRDEALCAINDEDSILPALGLHVAAIGLCLSKDSDWLSENEVLRVLIPGSREAKMKAAAALCEVNLWQMEKQGEVTGWRIGVTELLDAKRERHSRAKRAAEARYGKKDNADAHARSTSSSDADEESPF